MIETEMGFSLWSYLAPAIAVLIGGVITLIIDWWRQGHQQQQESRDDGG
jgi:hypothetical protein